MTKARYALLTVLVAGIVFAAGCNVFEGVQEEGTSDDPEVLYQDALAALERNEPEKAVDYLRRASDLQPLTTALGVRIDIKLASALLQTADLNVLTLRQMIRPFTDLPDAPPDQGTASKTNGLGCKFPATHVRLQFDPRQNVNYTILGADNPPSAEAKAEAQQLIQRVFTLNETSSDLGFPCDPQTLDNTIATLQGLGVSDAEIAEALVDYAVVLTTLAFEDVVNLGGVTDVEDVEFYYVFPPEGAAYVSACLPDVATCQAATVSVQDDLDDLACAALLLDRRVDLLAASDQSVAREVADLAELAQQKLAAGLSQPCFDVN